MKAAGCVEYEQMPKKKKITNKPLSNNGEATDHQGEDEQKGEDPLDGRGGETPMEAVYLHLFRTISQSSLVGTIIEYGFFVGNLLLLDTSLLWTFASVPSCSQWHGVVSAQ